MSFATGVDVGFGKDWTVSRSGPGLFGCIRTADNPRRQT